MTLGNPTMFLTHWLELSGVDRLMATVSDEDHAASSHGPEEQESSELAFWSVVAPRRLAHEGCRRLGETGRPRRHEGDEGRGREPTSVRQPPPGRVFRGRRRRSIAWWEPEVLEEAQLAAAWLPPFERVGAHLEARTGSPRGTRPRANLVRGWHCFEERGGRRRRERWRRGAGGESRGPARPTASGCRWEAAVGVQREPSRRKG